MDEEVRARICVERLTLKKLHNNVQESTTAENPQVRKALAFLRTPKPEIQAAALVLQQTPTAHSEEQILKNHAKKFRVLVEGFWKVQGIVCGCERDHGVTLTRTSVTFITEHAAKELCLQFMCDVRDDFNKLTLMLSPDKVVEPPLVVLERQKLQKRVVCVREKWLGFNVGVYLKDVLSNARRLLVGE